MSLAEERSAHAPGSEGRSQLGIGMSIGLCPVAMRCFMEDESVMPVSGMLSGSVTQLRIRLS